jgi:hypothetical protein
LAFVAAFARHAHSQPVSTTIVEVVEDAVLFDGRIDTRSAAQFLRLLENPKITRLVITSRGGIVPAALDMAQAIHERALDVEVPTACFSSCANYIFPAARRKTLGRLGAVAWHGNMTHVLYLHQTGQGKWSESQLESAREFARREEAFFRRTGVDGFVCWFAKIEPYTVADFYYLSVEDMERFGIASVTVRNASPENPENETVRRVQVDWTRLDAGRPFVRLDE